MGTTIIVNLAMGVSSMVLVVTACCICPGASVALEQYLSQVEMDALAPASAKPSAWLPPGRSYMDGSFSVLGGSIAEGNCTQPFFLRGNTGFSMWTGYFKRYRRRCVRHYISAG